MKKILLMIFVLTLVFVSCKGKQKPDNNNSIGTPEPPPLNVDVDVNDLIGALDNITTTGDAGGWGNNSDGWEENSTLLTGTADLKNKYLIGILNGLPHNIVYVLGINENSDMIVGSVPQTEPGAVNKAVLAAGDKKNWDPRKLLYDIGVAPNYNTGTRTVRIAWSGRAGDPPPSGTGLAFSEFKNYDTYNHVLSGVDGTFSVLPSSKYKVYFVLTDILTPKGQTFTSIKEENKANLLNFVYETDKPSDRKAWMWNHGDVIYSSTTARVLNPRSIRFAYGNNDFSYPYKADSTAATGLGKGSDALDLIGAIPAEANRYDNSAPTGKTIIARSQNQLKGGNPNWGDYIGDYAMFLTTVVGYNLRVRNYTGGDIGDLKASKIKEVVVEFDFDSFGDANKDGWNNISDTPSRGSATVEIGATGGATTYKIPFLLYDPS